MHGLMQDYPLTTVSLFERAERLWSKKEVVTSLPDGRHRYTYGDWAERTRRLGGVLDVLGISASGRVATFGWNSYRHLELYFAIPNTGRVLHTLNIRLFQDQLRYIVDHAEDEAIFVDRSLLGLLWPLVDTPEFKDVWHYVVMDDGKGDIPDDNRILMYEDLLAEAKPVEFDVRDENRAAAMAYTSGTTGNPKGVVYSHRSTVLHTLGCMTADVLAVSEKDTILPVVPMFHANAWGLAHAGVAAGSTLVFPGADLSPGNIVDLIESERVTVAAGVPTIWMGVLPALEGRDVSSLRAIPCGGSAVPKSLSEGYREAIGLPILQAWGMTETSPIASTGHIKSYLTDDGDTRALQGLPAPLVDIRIVEQDTLNELPWDNESTGELQARGPWIARDYYDDPTSREKFTEDGWLRTGDVAAITPEGYIRITDRTKDVIKSGGEWISSVELENEIMGHPKVAEAAVIALPHAKWAERPLACVVAKPGVEVTKEEILEHLSTRVAKWWLPDDIVFIDEVPKTSVGKFSKKTLRERFADYKLPTEGA
ncbi:MAG TPA: long-chain fatty acid--CoA ligase [Acidimicrobiales bacterium]|jgi:fatty-acyl-CoA synthase|nr:long-chain fatty acid--CoA ligase [Acidimicrobiales bacterium]